MFPGESRYLAAFDTIKFQTMLEPLRKSLAGTRAKTDFGANVTHLSAACKERWDESKGGQVRGMLLRGS